MNNSLKAKESLNYFVKALNEYLLLRKKLRSSICGGKKTNHKLTFKTCKKIR